MKQAIALAIALPATGALSAADGVLYELRPGSTLLDECLICGRPPVEVVLEGTFLLAPDPAGDGSSYLVSEVQLLDGGSQYQVTGGGSYSRADLKEEMSLDLTVNGAPSVKVGSGSVEEVADCFPSIDLVLSEQRDPPRDPAHWYRLHLVAAPRADYVDYRALKGTSLLQDCLRPCTRPAILVPLEGTFRLGKVEDNALFATYRLEGLALSGDAAGQRWTVSGSGCYTVGGEVAVLQKIELLASVNAGKPFPFSIDYGEVTAPFPQIEVEPIGKDRDAPILIYTLHLVAEPVAGFLRGDAEPDGILDIGDVGHLLNALFLGGAEPECLDAADANGDGMIDVSDPVFLLFYMFLGGEKPPAPGPDACGPSLGKGLGCSRYPRCGI